jgi:hypothetical protein
MSDLMREEFEEAFKKAFGFGRLLASANPDARQMMRVGLWAWQASRECLVIELPKPIEVEVVGVGCTCYSEYFDVEQVEKRIESYGVKIK